MPTLKRNIFAAGLQSVLQAVIYLVLYRFLLETIGIESIGVWSIILATTSAAKFGELGLAGSITKFVASYKSKNMPSAVVECIQTAFITLFVIVGIILLLLYPSLRMGLHHILPSNGLNDGLLILPWALISLFLASLSGICFSALDGVLRSDIRALIMIAGNIALLLLSILLVNLYGFVGLAYAQVGQSLLLLVSGWIAIKIVLPQLPVVPIQWKYARLKEMLNYGVNLQINSIVMLLFEPVTKIFLGKFGDLATVGVFELAHRLTGMARNFVIHANRVIVPVYAGADLEDKERYIALYNKNVRYLFFILTPFFLILISLTPSIAEIWLGELNIQFIVMCIFLSMIWYVNSITAPAYFAYLGQGRLFWVTSAHVVMGLINLFLGFSLGVLLSWVGVFSAFCIALIIGSIVPTLAFHKDNNIKITDILKSHDLKFVFFCVILSCSSLILFLLLKNIDTNIAVRALTITIIILPIYLFLIKKHPVFKEITKDVKFN